MVGVDRKNDIAVLKLDDFHFLPEVVKKLGYFPAEDSRDVLVGQEAIAIGSPFGLSNSLTEGVVSAVDRLVIGSDLGLNAGFNGFEDSDDFFYIRFNEIEKANILVEF